MALFKKTIGKKATPRTKTAKTVTAKADASSSYNAEVLVRPHVTEKAAILAEKGTYVFEIAPDANKQEVARAVQGVYGVTPLRVNIVNLPRTNVFVRGKRGVKKGVRKALVTLALGDKIELI